MINDSGDALGAAAIFLANGRKYHVCDFCSQHESAGRHVKKYGSTVGQKSVVQNLTCLLVCRKSAGANPLSDVRGES